MFILEAHKPGSARCWWAGGTNWRHDENMAALFKTKALAEATLQVLIVAGDLPEWQRNAVAVPIQQSVDVEDYPDS